MHAVCFEYTLCISTLLYGFGVQQLFQKIELHKTGEVISPCWQNFAYFKNIILCNKQDELWDGKFLLFKHYIYYRFSIGKNICVCVTDSNSCTTAAESVFCFIHFSITLFCLCVFLCIYAAGYFVWQCCTKGINNSVFLNIVSFFPHSITFKYISSGYSKEDNGSIIEILIWNTIIFFFVIEDVANTFN